MQCLLELTSEILQLKGLLAMQGGEKGLAELRKLREQLSESEKLMSEATRYSIRPQSWRDSSCVVLQVVAGEVAGDREEEERRGGAAEGM